MPQPAAAASTSTTTPSTREPIENPDLIKSKSTLLRVKPPGRSRVWPAAKKPKRSSSPRKNGSKKWGGCTRGSISWGSGGASLQPWGFAVISNGLGGVEGE
uniref:Uncharacterized protein n=1 Tax=Arundo donax TaxID=35708 RepID=A0A0A9FD16_ARUDO